MLVMLDRNTYSWATSTWSQSSLGWNFYCKLKKHKSPGSDQIPAELYQPGGDTLMSVIHKFITSILNKEEMPDQWKESIIVPIQKTGDKTDFNNYRGISLL
jgi:hypothetical protein